MTGIRERFRAELDSGMIDVLILAAVASGLVEDIASVAKTGIHKAATWHDHRAIRGETFSAWLSRKTA